jgi:hypothetical protein
MGRWILPIINCRPESQSELLRVLICRICEGHGSSWSLVEGTDFLQPFVDFGHISSTVKGASQLLGVAALKASGASCGAALFVRALPSRPDARASAGADQSS